MKPAESLPEILQDRSRQLVYFAAERTLTSWIRTALSLMTLGFVIDRFDLVLRLALGVAVQQRRQNLWRWTGSTMLVAGVVMAVAAGIYYLRYALRYRRTGETNPGRSLIVGSVFSLVLALIGGLIGAVLVYTLR